MHEQIKNELLTEKPTGPVSDGKLCYKHTRMHVQTHSHSPIFLGCPAR